MVTHRGQQISRRHADNFVAWQRELSNRLDVGVHDRVRLVQHQDDVAHVVECPGDPVAYGPIRRPVRAEPDHPRSAVGPGAKQPGPRLHPGHRSVGADDAVLLEERVLRPQGGVTGPDQRRPVVRVDRRHRVPRRHESGPVAEPQ
jgi:hypothetical protein